MSIHAGFIKRAFSFIIDLTLVIVVTWLLYLFPFNMIISKSIDKDYKHNIKKPYEEISETYSGQVSFFGTSSDGKLTILHNQYQAKQVTDNELSSYKAVLTANYNTVKQDLTNLVSNLDTPYSDETKMEEQLYSIIYRDYTYISEANTIIQKYPMDDIFQNEYDDAELGKFVEYSMLVGQAKLTEDGKTEKEKAYTDALNEQYKEVLELLIRALKVYDEKNDNVKVTSTLAYTTIASSYSSAKGKTSDVPVEFTNEHSTRLLEIVNTFRDYQVETLNIAANADGNVTINEEIYYNLYYGLYFEEFNLQLPYYAQVYEHTSWTIIYALAMFTLVFSVYTVVLRGNTLGRRSVKIRLTDGHEREKLNPVLALLHDVPFKFLYLILIGLFSLIAAGIALVVFSIADIIMIAFTKQHKCIRDFLSGTRVVEARNY